MHGLNRPLTAYAPSKIWQLLRPPWYKHLWWILWIGSAYALGHVRDSIPVPPKSSASLNRQGTDKRERWVLLKLPRCDIDQESPLFTFARTCLFLREGGEVQGRARARKQLQKRGV